MGFITIFHHQVGLFQENYVPHQNIAHPATAIPRSPTMKGIPAYSLLVKVAKGVCSSSVCWFTTLGNIFVGSLAPFASSRKKTKSKLMI